ALLAVKCPRRPRRTSTGFRPAVSPRRFPKRGWRSGPAPAAHPQSKYFPSSSGGNPPLRGRPRPNPPPLPSCRAPPPPRTPRPVERNDAAARDGAAERWGAVLRYKSGGASAQDKIGQPAGELQHGRGTGSGRAVVVDRNPPSVGRAPIRRGARVRVQPL